MENLISCRAMRKGPMRVLSNAGTDVVPDVLKSIKSLDPSTMVQHTVAVPFSGWSEVPFSGWSEGAYKSFSHSGAVLVVTN